MTRDPTAARRLIQRSECASSGQVAATLSCVPRRLRVYVRDRTREVFSHGGNRLISGRIIDACLE